MGSSVSARALCPLAAPEVVVGHVAALEGWQHRFLHSPFHLCRHDHLWVLVHQQVPEGEETLRSQWDQGLQTGN